MKTSRLLPALIPTLMLSLTPLSACSSPTPNSSTSTATETRLTSLEQQIAQLNTRLSASASPSAAANSTSTPNSDPEAIKELRVDPDPISVSVGSSTKLSLVLLVQNNDQTSVAKNFNLFGISSSDTSIATVSADGNVTGVRAGSTQITLRLGNVSKSVTVNVTAAAATPAPTPTPTPEPTPSPTPTPSNEIKAISLSPSTYTIVVNNSVPVATIVVTLQDDNTGILNNREAVTWSSSNTSIATINQSGVITARAVGSATITATYKGVSTSVPVTVTAS